MFYDASRSTAELEQSWVPDMLMHLTRTLQMHPARGERMRELQDDSSVDAEALQRGTTTPASGSDRAVEGHMYGRFFPAIEH